jgi:hypothetical protein
VLKHSGLEPATFDIPATVSDQTSLRVVLRAPHPVRVRQRRQARIRQWRRKLLAEAGFSAGLAVGCTKWPGHGPEYPQDLGRLASSLEEIGVDLQIFNEEYGQYSGGSFLGKFDEATWGRRPYSRRWTTISTTFSTAASLASAGTLSAPGSTSCWRRSGASGRGHPEDD